MELQQRGITADHYHADMDANVREKVHMRYVIVLANEILIHMRS